MQPFGLLNLDKPQGVSSRRVVDRVARLVRPAKAGHAGTLDPLASGLLPILFGEATKFSQLALDADKTYLARARLGVVTTTGDAEGEVLEERPCDVQIEHLEPVLARFRGECEQVPPMYSALKHGGRPLYAIAREGGEVPRAARRIQIHELELTAFAGDRLELRVVCSKGTYIRTLVEDIGRALGCGAHLAALRRVAAGGFRIEDAVTLERLASESPAERDQRLLPLERLLAGLPSVELSASLAERFIQGQALRVQEAPEGPCGVYGADRRLLGLGEGRAPGMVHPRRLISSDASG